MRLAPVENLEEAEIHLKAFYKIRGVFYEPLNKQIKDVFVGISDCGISSFHYLSKYGEGHEHTFTQDDLKNLFLYAVFTDNSIKLISELYDDSYLVDFIKEGKLQIEFQIKTDNEWSEPIKVPRGLSVIILLNEPEGVLEIQYKDVPYGVENSLIVKELGYKERVNMHYYNNFKEMKNPHIRFRAKDTASTILPMTITFVEHL